MDLLARIAFLKKIYLIGVEKDELVTVVFQQMALKSWSEQAWLDWVAGQIFLFK